MKDAILGIDVGTSSVKAVLFELDGAEVFSAGRPYPLLTPRPGWTEQDSEAVWEGLVLALREIVDGSSGYRILSMAIAAQAGSIIPADLDGDPVYPMITWLDNRSQEISRRWQADGTASVIRKRSGWQPFAGLPLPSISWLRQNRPDIHAAAKRFLGPADFLIHRLTGRFATDLSAASEMLLVDIKTGEWSEELCSIGGVDPSMQSEIGWAGRKVGEITDAVSRLTGLPSGMPVIAGGNDQPCAGLGMGMTEPGKVMLSTGTAWVIMSVVDVETTDTIPEWVNLYFHAVEGKRLAGQLVGGFGATVDWYLRQFLAAPGAPDLKDMAGAYETLNELVRGSPPGSRGLLFLSLGGPSQIMNAAAGGGFTGMGLAHSRADMSRALLEGCAYEVRWALDELRAAGIPVEDLWLAGGANRSPVWPQILSDACGVPIQLASYANWAALGGAILAGLGIGAYVTLEEGVARLRPSMLRLEPDHDLDATYAKGLKAYRRASWALHREKVE
jgi:xylulokinase